MEIYFIIIQVCSLLGFILSTYLLWQKSQKKKIICPFRDQCNDVLYSQYAKLFGIPTLTLGVLYYAAVFAMATYLQFTGTAPWAVPMELFLYLAVAAVLFSFYQAGIQLFILKKWCSWCLESTILSIVILAAIWILVY